MEPQGGIPGLVKRGKPGNVLRGERVWNRGVTGLRGEGDGAVTFPWTQHSSGSGVDEEEANASVGRTADRRGRLWFQCFGDGTVDCIIPDEVCGGE